MKENSMQSIRKCGIAALATLITALVAPAAYAQDNGGSSTGKRFAVTAGYSLLEPRSSPGTIAGARSRIDGDAAPTVSGSWYVNDNIALELWGAADKLNHRVRLNDAKTASVGQRPIALSGQYHFRAADSTVRPFVGLGYYESNFDNEQVTPGGPASGARLGVTTQKGAIATAGVDFNFNERWFARTDLRYLDGGADVEVNGAKAGEIELDPYVLGVGVGARF
jgi:outer membrane protein